MPYTQQQYDALKAAIASGAYSVRYGDKQVDYRSLAEMKQTLADMEAELGINPTKKPRKYASFTKGLRPGHCRHERFR